MNSRPGTAPSIKRRPSLYIMQNVIYQIILRENIYHHIFFKHTYGNYKFVFRFQIIVLSNVRLDYVKAN
jgi:hypothetical protein